ncbi:MAG: HYR domain-containing protein [Bacteroidota bacterium]
MPLLKITLILLLGSTYCSISLAQSAFQLSTSRTDNTFEVDDYMSFNVEAFQTGIAEFRIRHAPNVAPIEVGEIPMQAGKTYNVFFSLPHAGTVWFEIRMGNNTATIAAVFGTFAIQPKEAEPADFDAFWENAQRELNEIPIDPKLRFHSSTDYSDTYTINLGMIDRRRVYGYISIPKTSGRYPAILTLPSYGSRPNLVKPEQELAERVGAISMTISIHDAPLGEQVENPYQPDNFINPAENYFRYAILASLRAVDYIETRSDFNGKLAVNGVSQGGGLAIMTAGLIESVDLLVFSNPTHAEHQGTRYGRASGFPYYLEQVNRKYPGNIARYEQAAKAIKYYDASYFASRYNGQSLAIVGYNDQVCPAATTLAAFNQLGGPKILFHATQLGHQHPNEYWNGRKDAFRRFLDPPAEAPFPYAKKTKGYFVDAGADTSIQVNEFYQLKGQAWFNENRLTENVKWAKVSGNGRVIFRARNQLNTEVSFTDTGRYELALWVKDDRMLAETYNFYSLIDRVNIQVTAVAAEEIFEVICPPDLSVYASGDAAVVRWQLPQLSTTSCEDQNISIQQRSGAAWGSRFAVGQHEIRYLVKDACGQETDCAFEITVLEDTTSIFEVACPPDLVAYATGNSATLRWELPKLIQTSCADSDLSIQQTVGQAWGSDFEVGQYEITYLVKDACDQAVRCSFEITVLADTTAQVFNMTCPTDIYATVPIFGATVNIEWDEPSVSVPCEEGYFLRRIKGVPSGSKFTVGIAEIVYQLKDNCGNEMRCSFRIIVNLAPTIPNNNNDRYLLFPNPVQDEFQLNWTHTAAATFEVYDLLGRRVLRQPLHVGNEPYRYDTRHWAAGHYLWRIVGNGVVLSSGKLVKCE